jgi:hypothetical protein
MEEVEVRVHRVRRRRSEPVPTEPSRPPNLRNWLIYGVLTGLVLLLMFEGYLNHKPRHPALPSVAEATGVRSAISPAADSLRVVVSWDLTLSAPEGRPDSVDVKVVSNRGGDSLIQTRLASLFADTVYLAAPPPGQTLTGSSCVAAKHPSVPLTESCTPWQYVQSQPGAAAAAAGAQPETVMILPSGLQVDPDTGGRCARWQRSHPGESVWISVNRVAVRDCTGPNGKPTVAQFCAVVIPQGSRQAALAETGRNRYCEELLVEWSRDRVS